MEIKYFDFCYRIIGDYHKDMKKILKINYQKVYLNELPFVDGLCDFEIYQIMRQPVITLAELESAKIKKADFWLEILVCSCFQGRWFLYLFSGGKWKSYYVNF
jgi:hypothetical protein